MSCKVRALVLYCLHITTKRHRQIVFCQVTVRVYCRRKIRDSDEDCEKSVSVLVKMCECIATVSALLSGLNGL